MRSGHVFETSLGFVGLDWNERGLTRLVLPTPDRATAEKRLAGWGVRTDAGDAPRPDFIDEAIRIISDYARGEAAELAAIPVDLGSLDAFDIAILQALRRLGHGEVVTYGELAERSGNPGMARETGAALGRNPVPLVVPCHRVVAAGGKLGGFSAPGGSRTKARLLAHEHARLAADGAQASFAF